VLVLELVADISATGILRGVRPFVLKVWQTLCSNSSDGPIHVRDGVVGDVRGRLANILTPGGVVILKARGEGGGGGHWRRLLLGYANRL
jgi:hypothetical protein